MNKRAILSILISIILFPLLLTAQITGAQKKIIEFGWDYPKISFLKNNLQTMQKTPFDGVVFSFDFDIYNAFDNTRHSDSDFQYNELAKLNWGNFTDNFLFVRGASYTGAHWLDDDSWIQIVNNLKKVSKALVVSKAKGIGFDPEYYYNDSTLNPWVYRASWYNNLSYEEVGIYVRKRGKQFIQALQSSKPDVKILCFWLLGLIDMQSQTQPVSETGMALYPFFVEGMLEGQNKYSQIIDGNEYSYGFEKAEKFIESGHYLREEGSKFIMPSLQSKFKKIQLAQAIYFDLTYAKIPGYDKGYNQETKSQWLRNNLYAAFKSTDKYVWFYNERINWWKGEVDSGVAAIIIEVKNAIKKESLISVNQIHGQSKTDDFKTKDSQNGHSFDYTYLVNKKILEIKVLNKDIQSIEVYSNSRLIYKKDNPSADFTVPLNKRYNKKGNLMIMARQSNGTASIAYVN